MKVRIKVRISEAEISVDRRIESTKLHIYKPYLGMFSCALYLPSTKASTTASTSTKAIPKTNSINLFLQIKSNKKEMFFVYIAESTTPHINKRKTQKHILIKHTLNYQNRSVNCTCWTSFYSPHQIFLKNFISCSH